MGEVIKLIKSKSGINQEIPSGYVGKGKLCERPDYEHVYERLWVFEKEGAMPILWHDHFSDESLSHIVPWDEIERGEWGF